MTTLRRLSGTAVLIAVASMALVEAPLALAHHSAALFYEMGGQRITLKGVVMRWNFRNPHAIVELDVKNDKGEIEH